MSFTFISITVGIVFVTTSQKSVIVVVSVVAVEASNALIGALIDNIGGIAGK